MHEGDAMAIRRSERVWWLSVLAMASTLLWSVTVLAQESIGQVASLQGQATAAPRRGHELAGSNWSNPAMTSHGFQCGRDAP